MRFLKRDVKKNAKLPKDGVKLLEKTIKFLEIAKNAFFFRKLNNTKKLPIVAIAAGKTKNDGGEIPALIWPIAIALLGKFYYGILYDFV